MQIVFMLKYILAHFGGKLGVRIGNFYWRVDNYDFHIS